MRAEDHPTVTHEASNCEYLRFEMFWLEALPKNVPEGRQQRQQVDHTVTKGTGPNRPITFQFGKPEAMSKDAFILRLMDGLQSISTKNKTFLDIKHGEGFELRLAGGNALVALQEFKELLASITSG